MYKKDTVFSNNYNDLYTRHVAINIKRLKQSE